MEPRLLYLHALSPIHSGTGQSADVIDLPVARETVTNWPHLPGSSLKGVLRDACSPADTVTEDERARFTRAFGPDTEHADQGAGCLWFADARLLCLPVRSLAGSLAWITCPLALRRWQRDHPAGHANATLPIPTPAAQGIALAPANTTISRTGTVYLEDLDLAVAEEADVVAIAAAIGGAVFDATWQPLFAERFGIVADDLFGFLAETATEVVARIKLRQDTKTVQRGGLWYEEAVPAESIFVAPVIAAPRNGTTAASLFDVLSPGLDTLLQIGGGASVGRGLVMLRLSGGSAP